MGKAGRAACIFVPWVLTLASFVCLLLLEVSGTGNGGKGELSSYYFIKANFTGLDISDATSTDNTTTLTDALEVASEAGDLADLYEIHLWNYCYSNSSTSNITACTKRKTDFYFDIITVWGLNDSDSTSTSTSSSSSALSSIESSLANSTETLEDDLLGKSGREAFNIYKKVSVWMFIAYQVSFFTTLATLLVAVFALCSRLGSLLTWIFALISSLFTFGAVLTSTILFVLLREALYKLLNPYGITIELGRHALVLTWLAVITSWAATLFWLFSTCCCSGRSSRSNAAATNPHHRSNKGGLWRAEPKGQGYRNYNPDGGDDGAADDDNGAFQPVGNNNRRIPSLRVGKPGAGVYEPVSNATYGVTDNRPLAYGDRVPLAEYPQPQAGYADVPPPPRHQVRFEPMRNY